MRLLSFVLSDVSGLFSEFVASSVRVIIIKKTFRRNFENKPIYRQVSLLKDSSVVATLIECGPGSLERKSIIVIYFSKKRGISTKQTDTKKNLQDIDTFHHRFQNH